MGRRAAPPGAPARRGLGARARGERCAECVQIRLSSAVGMAAITGLLEELRGEKAPAQPFDHRKARADSGARPRGRTRSDAPAKAAVFGTGSWGTAFAMVLADAGCEVTLWGRRARARRRHQHHPDEPGLPARRRTPRRVTRHHRPRRGRARRRLRRPRHPLADAARQPRRLGAAARARHRARLPDEGRRTRHRQADERGHRGGRQGPAPTGSPWCPGPTWRRRSPPASPPPPSSPARDEAVAQRLQAACHTAVLPPVHQHRRGRLRTGRRGQERHRPRRRHRRRHGPRRQRQGAR